MALQAWTVALGCLALLSLTGQACARTCVCATTQGGTGLNIRGGPGTSYSIVGSLMDGYCVDYISTSGNWYKIDYASNVDPEWVHKDYVSGPQTCGGGSWCTNRLCSSYSTNQLRSDPAGDGHYGASRGSRLHKGTDVKCGTGDTAYAPFDGILVREAKPYGDGSCCDEGYLLRGTGDWDGYEAKVFYTEPTSSLIGQSVAKGDVIGTHRGVLCGGCYSSPMTEHAHFQMYKINSDGSTTIIDGTSWVLCH